MNQWNMGGAEVDSPPAPINGKIEAGSNASRQEKRVSKSLSKAVSLHLEGKLDDAMYELRRTIDSGERHPALFSALGHVQYEVQDYAAAVNSYAQLLELEPGHRTGHFNMAVSLGKLARWGEAAASFEKALEIDSRRSEAYLGLGTLPGPFEASAGSPGCLQLLRLQISRSRRSTLRQGRAPCNRRVAWTKLPNFTRRSSPRIRNPKRRSPT